MYNYIGYILLFVYILLNNVNSFKKYYYPPVNRLIIAICKYIDKKAIEIKQIKTHKEEKPPEKFTTEMYSKIPLKNLKMHQDKLAFNYSIAVLNLNSDLNVGAIYRTGCLLGMKKYYILGKKIYYPKSQVGIELVDIEYIDIFPKLRDRYDRSTLEDFNEDMFVNFIRRNNFTPIVIEQGGENLLGTKLKETNKCNYLFIFGNEKFGVPKKMIEIIKRFNNHLIISIPQWGCAHSYNVSQAANIIMWEYYKQNVGNKINLLN
jgi:tRNA G18 (ribose-2'-O)-methylase SpoU